MAICAFSSRLLTGNVEKILQKGAYTRDSLLREVRKVVAIYQRFPDCQLTVSQLPQLYKLRDDGV